VRELGMRRKVVTHLLCRARSEPDRPGGRVVIRAGRDQRIAWVDDGRDIVGHWLSNENGWSTRVCWPPEARVMTVSM